ncbi:hypothetical protein TNCV_1893511 [Trichonephila clavipes]|nr:hypothetical protein TNCV_1893511 [Trichonephila clavipes]
MSEVEIYSQVKNNYLIDNGSPVRFPGNPGNEPPRKHVFYRRKNRRASRPEKQFNLVINEEPLDNECHMWSRIILFKYGCGQALKVLAPTGQLAPTPRRYSDGCLKYPQCVLEECEKNIQYRPIP